MGRHSWNIIFWLIILYTWLLFPAPLPPFKKNELVYNQEYRRHPFKVSFREQHALSPRMTVFLVLCIYRCGLKKKILVFKICTLDIIDLIWHNPTLSVRIRLFVNLKEQFDWLLTVLGNRKVMGKFKLITCEFKLILCILRPSKTSK